MAKGAGKHLRPAYCLTLVSEASRKSQGKRPADGQGRRKAFKAKLRKAAKSAGKGAAERLYESYCLTLLSEATGEARRKRPADGERRARRSRKAAKSAGKGAADRL